ncbi:uncharacterized protein B0H18DRAFT_966299 [Fomitopsis serialis]|uniref:uncharacterized protein n=1 Tax=Fomitopsis serialis TaxID=139415 RepID=UPI002008A545|nr:uncharacterized protein B0H18DRAFT_966299 [Neoantrodia serialis]KAH9938265.1 hypothetical protein B0H18DRAFT_966299 [Neoantrodia serialis]
MHLPFTPNHVYLVSACYPPSAALLTSGPDYLPNSQELSRLTYYASNRSGKITKLASELEKRVKTDCRKAQAGNTRSRASLLITLYIFKALSAECRRDIALLTNSLLSAVNATLSTLLSDLEVAARAATVFTAWATYTDGHLIGVDRDVTQNYMSCLQHFSSMGQQKLDDRETRNRTRLVGLAALIAAVHSEALYHTSTHFKLQVSTVTPALLIPLLDVDVETLNQEACSIKEQPKFAFMDDFRTRPALERRAASIHVHVDGDKGPSSGDVVNASLHAISSLFGHSTGMQAAVIMSAVLDHFDDSGGWSKIEYCRWIAAKAAEWTQYQYRYAVPTRLVECLVEGQDASEPTVRHSTLAAMVTTVFTSPTPLVNLSTSDMISNLISLVFRRISINLTDGLLPTLVECIASLGTHVYYADQIQDLAGELISRIVMVESNGLPAAMKADGERSRSQALRCLLASLLGLMHAADLHESAREDATGSPTEVHVAGTSPNLPSTSKPDPRDVHIRPSRRTKIAPEVWHDTLILLCDRDYAVRADYATPKLGDHTDAEGSKRRRSLAEGPTDQAHTTTAIMSRRSMVLSPRVRKTSFIVRAMASVPKKLSHSAPPAAHFRITATCSLYAAAASFSPVLQQLVARTWSVIGRVWKCPEVVQRAEEAVSDLPPSALLPSIHEVLPGTLPPPQQPVPFPGQEPMADLPDLDSEAMWRSIANSQVVAETTGLDSEGLGRRLAAAWSAESAFTESVEANSAYDTLGRDALSPLIRVAPALMHIENISLQSLTRSTRGVGGTVHLDLDHTSSVAHPETLLKLTPTKSRGQQRSRLAGPGEVRDVLNKLGIGKQNGTSQLKSSFSTFQKPEQRAPPLTPPYKA